MTWTGEDSAAQPAPAPESPTPTQPKGPGVAPETFSCPRAGFWERMGAAFLDLVFLGVASSLADSLGGSLGVAGSSAGLAGLPMPWVFLATLAYFAGMWTWKGNHDSAGPCWASKSFVWMGKPLDFMVALVRGLAAALSIVVLFLGFLWIAWDPGKQGWHDRIAGTRAALPRQHRRCAIRPRAPPGEGARPTVRAQGVQARHPHRAGHAPSTGPGVLGLLRRGPAGPAAGFIRPKPGHRSDDVFWMVEQIH